MVTLCYERFGHWYAGGLSWIGYAYQSIMEEEDSDWFDLWNSVEEVLANKKIYSSKNLKIALWGLEKLEND